MTLIVVLALVAVPAAGSRNPSGDSPIDPTHFQRLEPGSGLRGTAVTTATLDPARQSAGRLEPDSMLVETSGNPARLRTSVVQPNVRPGVVLKAARSAWRRDGSVSWYGPGFYGHRTACGLALTTALQGVANRTLPCGTMVKFRNPANGRVITVPVVDRGPYVAGRQWDLTGAACRALGHCYTGPLLWRFP